MQLGSDYSCGDRERDGVPGKHSSIEPKGINNY